MNVAVIRSFNANLFQFLIFFPINPLLYGSSYVSISFITWIVLEGIIIVHVSLS